MNISGNAFSAGLSGIYAGQRRLDQAAQNIAAAPASTAQGSTAVAAGQDGAALKAPDLAQSLVEQRVAETDVRTSTRVIETADEALGTLIDTRA